MLFATNRGAAQEKNFACLGFSVAEVHHHRRRKSPITNNSAASDDGSHSEMMLIQATPRQSVALPKTIERRKSVGRDFVEPQVVDRTQLTLDATSARPHFFVGNMPMPRLLNLDLCPSRFDFLFHLVSFGFGHAFLDRLWRALYKRFRFRQAKTRHRAAHFLDHADLVGAHFL